MTTVSQIITDAYRQSNILAIGASPTTPQQDEALRYLNRIIKSVYGNEAGEKLEAFPIGRNGIDRPSSFPWYDQTPDNDWFVPKNKQLVLNLTDALTVYLHPMPDDGTRFAIVDTSDNLDTHNLTIDGNGRQIEDAETVTVAEAGVAREWFYRQDLGSWQRLSDLTLESEFPFPEQFDDLFITMLAMRLNPSYGAGLDQQSLAVMNRMRSQFRARYKIGKETPVEDALIRLPRMVADRDGWTRDNFYGDSTSAFDRGLPW